MGDTKNSKKNIDFIDVTWCRFNGWPVRLTVDPYTAFSDGLACTVVPDELADPTNKVAQLWIACEKALFNGLIKETYSICKTKILFGDLFL